MRASSLVNLLAFAMLLSPGAIGATTDDTSPQGVIVRLVENTNKKPLGPVENDVTEQTVKTLKAMAEDPMFKGSMDSLRESIAAEYRDFNVEGGLTCLYSDGPAALYYSKVKLTATAVAEHKDDAGSPGFGESGGFSVWVGPTIRSDGHVIATFCLVQQHGLWKVHGLYLSNDVLDGSNKDFISHQLIAFAKKQ